VTAADIAQKILPVIDRVTTSTGPPG
jgi:hypothetical protein